jgi:hypothetical protein
MYQLKWQKYENFITQNSCKMWSKGEHSFIDSEDRKCCGYFARQLGSFLQIIYYFIICSRNQGPQNILKDLKSDVNTLTCT